MQKISVGSTQLIIGEDEAVIAMGENPDFFSISSMNLFVKTYDLTVPQLREVFQLQAAILKRIEDINGLDIPTEEEKIERNAFIEFLASTSWEIFRLVLMKQIEFLYIRARLEQVTQALTVLTDPNSPEAAFLNALEHLKVIDNGLNLLMDNPQNEDVWSKVLPANGGKE